MLLWKLFMHATRLYTITVKGQEMYNFCQAKLEEKLYMYDKSNSHSLTVECSSKLEMKHKQPEKK